MRSCLPISLSRVDDDVIFYSYLHIKKDIIMYSWLVYQQKHHKKSPNGGLSTNKNITKKHPMGACLPTKTSQKITQWAMLILVNAMM